MTSPTELQMNAHLETMAQKLRKTILTMIHQAASGHPGGSLSAADIVAVLYFEELRITQQPNGQTAIVLSSPGHVCPVLYSALALRLLSHGCHLHAPKKVQCTGILI